MEDNVKFGSIVQTSCRIISWTTDWFDWNVSHTVADPRYHQLNPTSTQRQCQCQSSPFLQHLQPSVKSTRLMSWDLNISYTAIAAFLAAKVRNELVNVSRQNGRVNSDVNRPQKHKAPFHCCLTHVSVKRTTPSEASTLAVYPTASIPNSNYYIMRSSSTFSISPNHHRQHVFSFI